MRIASLSLLALCLTLAAVPAMAQILYDNGPENAEVDAWTINEGYAVSDTFRLTTPGTPEGMTFAVWLTQGDAITSVQLSIGTTAFGTMFSGIASVQRDDCFVNQFNYNVCIETATFSGPNLNTGNYWLTLQNAVVTNNDPVYWDENSGVGCISQGCPSSAQENTVGTIPSETFTLYGEATTSTSTGTTPEPGSIMLFGSGIVGLAGVLRRKLF